MKDPQYSNYFPLSEYQGRIRRLRKAMQAEDMDAVLMSNEPDVVYFTGSLNGYWICTCRDDAQLALITADPADEPILFFPDHLRDVARTSCITDIRGWSQFSGGKSKSPIETIADAFADLKLTKARIGMEIGPHNRPGMSPAFMSELRDELLDGELFLHIDEVRYVVDRWRMDYNHYRPHSSLGYVSPVAFAATCGSPGSAPPHLPNHTYQSVDTLIKGGT